ncbi:MAG: hypothetical protein AAF502_05155 [Bacteroidota bacterium]
MCKLFRNLFGGRRRPQPEPQPDPAIDNTDPVIPDPQPDPPPVVDPVPQQPSVKDGEFAVKAANLADLPLEVGLPYLINDDDITGYGEVDYESIAEHHGMHKISLRAFNPETVHNAGDMLYIPSKDELCFMAYFKHHGNLADAINGYENLPATPNRVLLYAARYRASGELGKAYGTSSLEFITPNNNLVGAFESKSKEINGQREYRVNWGANLWKCNIFTHDCVFHSGHLPDVMANQHYITAGSLQRSNRYKQLTIDEVTPGCIAQLYNGSGSNSSHNMILVSFIMREKIHGEEHGERWSFEALGAESDRCAASIRHHVVSTDTTEDFYEVLTDRDFSGRKYIRFFKPLYKRDLP